MLTGDPMARSAILVLGSSQREFDGQRRDHGDRRSVHLVGLNCDPFAWSSSTASAGAQALR
jgi:hypothetical protein